MICWCDAEAVRTTRPRATRSANRLREYAVTLARCLFVVCLLACGKVEDLGSGLDETAGAPDGAGTAQGEGGAPCVPMPGVEVVAPEQLDTSGWRSDAECDEVAVEIEERLGVVPASQPISQELAGHWLAGEGGARVELVLDPSGRGQLTLGEPVPPPILDVQGGYLSGLGEFDGAGIVSTAPRALSGFTYRVRAREALSGDTRIDIELAEPWEKWCMLQLPVRRADCYGCDFAGASQYVGAWCEEPSACFVSESKRSVRVHCGRLALCGVTHSVCLCTEHFCTYDRDIHGSYLVSLDAADPNRLRFDEDLIVPKPRYLARVLDE